MSQTLRGLLENYPMIAGMMTRASGGLSPALVEKLLVPIIVGAISAIGGSQITTARLDERMLSESQRNAEFRAEIKARITSMDAVDNDVRDRLTRMESRYAAGQIQNLPASERRPR